MLTRVLFGIAAGTVVTSLLFLLMQELIESDWSPFEELAMGTIVDFVPVVEDIEVKTTRVPPKRPPDPDEMPPDPPDPVLDITKGKIGTEIEPPTALRLNPLIERLWVVQREALIMRKEAGLTIGEIAGITGVTEEGVKSRLRYAVNRLRRGMRGYV